MKSFNRMNKQKMKSFEINLERLNNEMKIKFIKVWRKDNRPIPRKSWFSFPLIVESTVCHFISDYNVVTQIYLSRYEAQDIAQPLPPGLEVGGQLGRGHEQPDRPPVRGRHQLQD